MLSRFRYLPLPLYRSHALLLLIRPFISSFSSSFLSRSFSSIPVDSSSHSTRTAAVNPKQRILEPFDPSTSGFHSLDLSLPVVQSLSVQFNVSSPTEIQRLAIPPILAGRSICLASQTGSGKTFSYLLPIVELLKRDESQRKIPTRAFRPRCVIMLPNRELTHQMLFVCKQLSHLCKFRSEAISGGEELAKQRRDLDGPVDVLITTPGRLAYYMQRKTLFLSDCSYFVLDEADTLFNEQNGFIPLIKQILGPIRERMRTTDKTCQFVLSSASLPQWVQYSIQKYFPEMEYISSSHLHRLPSQLIQRFLSVDGQDKLELLVELLRREAKEFEGSEQQKKGFQSIEHQPAPRPGMDAENDEDADSDAFEPLDPVQSHLLGPRSSITPRVAQSFATQRNLPILPPTLIFCNTVDSCRAVDYYLNENGFAGSVSSYHGEIPPKMRAAFFRSFVLGLKPILVCTDVASRGLDTRGVAHVVQFDMAKNAVDYLHRVGRTARIGKPGKTTALVTRHDQTLAEEIKRATLEDKPLRNIHAEPEEANNVAADGEKLPKHLRHAPPLYEKLGVRHPARREDRETKSRGSLKAIVKAAKSKRSGEPIAIKNPKWDRYKTPDQRLKETIEGSLAKEHRLWKEKMAKGTGKTGPNNRKKQANKPK